MTSEGTVTPTRTVLTGTKGKKYTIAKSLGYSPQFNLYECVLEDGRPGIFKIANDITFNDTLDRESFVLRLMAEHAAGLDADNTDEKGRFNYDVFFPRLVDSFVVEDQENRRANVMKFTDRIQILEELTTISGLCEVEKVRVDPRTGAWILGKLIKVLSFAHRLGISNRRATTDNILIEREMHGLILFDWSQAILPADGVPRYITSEELSSAGLVAVEVLGGNLETGELPKDDQLTDDRFQHFIQRLVKGEFFDAAITHREFYDLIWTLWPREFHPFTVYPKAGGVQ